MKTLIRRHISIMMAIIILLPTFAIGKDVDEKIMKATSITAIDDLVFAIHPYTGDDKTKINLTKRTKHSLPVGILIQNYKPYKIAIECIRVKSSDGVWVDVPQFTPYTERPAGAIGGREFFDDATRLNQTLRDKYKPDRAIPRLGMNEIFYSPVLDSGHAFYGLVFIEGRKNNFEPTSVNRPELLTMEVVFVGDNFANRYIAKLNLNGSKGVVDADDSDRKGNAVNCHVDNCKKMKAEDFNEIGIAFRECYSRSVGKNVKSSERVWGKSASATVMFDGNGGYLAHEMTSMPGDKRLDGIVGRIARGMTNCLPKHLSQDGPYEQVFYSKSISFGDGFAEQIRREKTAAEN